MSTKKNQKAINVTTTNGVVQYAVRDGIPLPTRAGRGKASHFPFATLKPTQAFVVTLTDEGLADIDALKSRVRSAIYAASKRLGVSFVSEADGKNGFMTVWRAPEA